MGEANRRHEEIKVLKAKTKAAEAREKAVDDFLFKFGRIAIVVTGIFIVAALVMGAGHASTL